MQSKGVQIDNVKNVTLLWEGVPSKMCQAKILALVPQYPHNADWDDILFCVG